jgi:hypothetical protein
MGLDVYFIPSLNMSEIREDNNLEIDGASIKMTNNNSSIMSYVDSLDEVEDMEFFRLNRHSEDIVKYLAETYHRLVAADGFHNDSGYKLHYDGTLQDVIDEMLQYKEEYGWSDEFVKELEKKRTEMEIEMIAANACETLPEDVFDENYEVVEVTYTGTK